MKYKNKKNLKEVGAATDMLRVWLEICGTVAAGTVETHEALYMTYGTGE